MILKYKILLLLILLTCLFSSCKNFVNPNEIEDADDLNPISSDIINISQGLILHDTFNALPANPSQNEPIYVNYVYTPRVGPNATLRTWHNFVFSGGATNTSIANESQTGKFGKALQFNYSGDDSIFPERTQDTVAYPVGNLMNTSEGTIEFWFRPHFSHNEVSNKNFYIIGGTKDHLNAPLNIDEEKPNEIHIDLSMAYHTFEDPNDNSLGITLAERDFDLQWVDGFAYFFNNIANDLLFFADQWIHLAFVYKADGINALGGKTIVVFFNGVLAGSSVATFNFSFPHFKKYLIFGGNIRGRLGTSRKYRNGASGDFDNIKIWNYAKTNFSDRFVE